MSRYKAVSNRGFHGISQPDQSTSKNKKRHSECFRGETCAPSTFQENQERDRLCYSELIYLDDNGPQSRGRSGGQRAETCPWKCGAVKPGRPRRVRSLRCCPQTLLFFFPLRAKQESRVCQDRRAPKVPQ